MINNQKINGFEVDSLAIYKELEKSKFRFHDLTKILINSNNTINEIDSYEAKTGVMIGHIPISDNNDIYLIIFDYDIIIIKDADLQNFPQLLDKITSITTQYYIDDECKQKFEKIKVKKINSTIIPE